MRTGWRRYRDFNIGIGMEVLPNEAWVMLVWDET